MESSGSKETTARNRKSEDAMSKILEAKVKPLFSLPPELMSPKRYKRKRQDLIRRKDKVQKFRESSYTAKRLREEKFRRYEKLHLY